MSELRVSKAVRCEWKKRKGERDVYDCPVCGCWTANLPLYRDSVCPNKDRRKAERDRRQGAPALIFKRITAPRSTPRDLSGERKQPHPKRDETA